MGQNSSSYISSSYSFTKNLLSKKRRREDSESDLEDEESALERSLNTKRRKKLQSTSDYIYRTMFLEGQNSDVTIVALGRSWKLHRVNLSQSPYFASMFSGSWKESTESTINIEIQDPNITIVSLTICFGSLYKDEITLDGNEAIGVAAAASLFQMEPLLDYCSELLRQNVSVHTAVKFYETAIEYGMLSVKSTCFDWLSLNLMHHVHEHPSRLREISVELMTELVKYNNLYVIQTEFSIYVLLKLWMFLKLHPAWSGCPKDMITATQEFLENRNEKASLLETEIGKPFERAFRVLKADWLIVHPYDVEMLKNDRIIPNSFLNIAFQNQWFRMLRVEQGIDSGPTELDEEDFFKNCLRCGRLLQTDSQHMWRWTGYNFGLDLVMSYDKGGIIKIKRNARSDNSMSLSQQRTRNIMYRIVATTVNDFQQVMTTQSTGVKLVTLHRSEDVRVMTLDPDLLVFPVILSVNFLVVSPVATDQ
ncbi:germ cell-less protein-like 1 [Artemia franciscana]|uniref:BTB domain-containing protein n=1 Tax=Artemia franciscana TaxID=6661 RepID=A0AA88HM63_ARTSF|nr:hypothetical protein QYM36_013314 [Artemia franciscana]KAK2709600.1 hypothetical protein QYM36_013314 [Artemia franciscana]